MAILEDRQSGYINILYHTFKLHTSVVVVVAQGIRLTSISVVRVARPTTSRYIRVESQGPIEFTLETHNILPGNIPDTLGERVPQIICSPGERVISSLPRSTSRRENRSVTYAYMHPRLPFILKVSLCLLLLEMFGTSFSFILYMWMILYLSFLLWTLYM